LADNFVFVDFLVSLKIWSDQEEIAIKISKLMLKALISMSVCRWIVWKLSRRSYFRGFRQVALIQWWSPFNDWVLSRYVRISAKAKIWKRKIHLFLPKFQTLEF